MLRKYRDAERIRFNQMAELIEQLADPRHRAILENYRLHNALEQGGRWEEVLVPDLVVDHPVYRVTMGPEQQVLDGKEGVGGWYAANMGVAQSLVDERIAVADWGLASWSTHVMFASGERLRELGFDVEQPDATYKVEMPLGMFWTYDGDVKLVGENIFKLGEPVVSAADPDDTLTYAGLLEQCREFLDAVEA